MVGCGDRRAGSTRVRDELALARLATALALPVVARTQLLLAGLVEEDSRFGQVFADLNGGLARRPTFETLATVGQRIDPAGAAVALGQLVELGVLVVTGEAGPRSEWVLAPAREISDQLRGDGHHPPRPPPARRPARPRPTSCSTSRPSNAPAGIAARWDDLDLS